MLSGKLKYAVMVVSAAIVLVAVAGAQTDGDVGSVAYAGSESHSGSTYTIKGSGNDIWGNQDAFNFYYVPLSGDGTVVAHVDSVQNTSSWAKAGVMMRASLAANADQVSMMETAGNGALLEWRNCTGCSSAANQGPANAAPYWVKLVRSGSTFTGYVSATGSSWTEVGATTVSMGTTVYIGAAVTAHNSTALNTSTFDSLSFVSGGATPVTVSISPATVSVATSATQQFAATVSGTTNTGVTWTATGGSITSSGLYAAGTTAGTYTVTATSVADSAVKASATVTVTDPPSAVGVSISPATTSVATGSTQQFTASVSGTTNTGVTWKATGGSITSSGLYTAGSIAGTYSVTATSVADSTKSASAIVTVTDPPSTAGATDLDIGSVAYAGSESLSGSTYTIKGSGSDIWGNQDAFNFYYVPLSGDGTVVAHVDSVQNTSSWAKAGVMMRASLAANADQISMMETAGNGTLLEWRNCTGCSSAAKQGPANAAPYWVKLVRSGSTFTGYVSATGSSWTEVGATTVSMGTTVYIGAAVTAHNSTALNTSTFDSLSFVSGGATPVTVSVTPATATVASGATQQFAASVSGATNTAVTWSATGGSITSSGLYTAGSTAGTYTVTATSAANTSIKASAVVTVPDPPSTVAISVSPSSTSVASGATQQFAAAVSGTTNTGVTWTATGGTISSSGLYTAGSTTGTFSVTATSIADTSKSATATVTVTAPASGRLFTSSTANWLYSAPTGTGMSISSTTSSMSVTILTHSTDWDYPVQYTDATHGYTTFTDTLVYARTDVISVPNPSNGYWPSLGSDGHLVVIDTTHNMYYDFWKLSASNGVPTSTNVGEIKSGSLTTSNGTYGGTAVQMTGAAGTILPSEISCETCLNHALSVTVPAAMDSPIWGTQALIAGGDGSVSGGIFREGAKIQFDPSINIDSLTASTAVKAIMRALQLYGGLITDQSGGSGFGLYSSVATQPDTTGINLISQHLLIYY